MLLGQHVSTTEQAMDGPSTPSTSSSNEPTLPPLLPHDLPSAAYATAPCSDLHLAHILDSLPAPDWLTLHNASQGGGGAFGPETVSNDRFAPDELDDLPADQAERCRASYQIEDHLDAVPGNVLIFEGGRTLEAVVEEVEDALEGAPAGKPVLVSRLWVQPVAGRGYYWLRGGADFVRFEKTADGDLLWRPIEVVLSQGVDVRTLSSSSERLSLTERSLQAGHRIVALLHYLHLAAVLPSLPHLKPAEPLIWLVNPVEYAHAQLREMTQWGWSEHMVALDPTVSRPPSRLDGEEYPSPDDLLPWLRNLLDHRIDHVLHLPGGCLSPNLLPAAPIDLHKMGHFSAVATPGPGLATYPLAALATARGSPSPSRDPTTPPPSAYSNSSGERTPPSSQFTDATSVEGEPPPPNSPRASASSYTLSQPTSLVSSTFLLEPPPDVEQLPYFACRGCGEHAFKIALSKRLIEEQERREEWGEPIVDEPWTPSVDDPLSSSALFGRRQIYVVGLGPKGKAANEAMDKAEEHYWAPNNVKTGRLVAPPGTPPIRA